MPLWATASAESSEIDMSIRGVRSLPDCAMAKDDVRRGRYGALPINMPKGKKFQLATCSVYSRVHI